MGKTRTISKVVASTVHPKRLPGMTNRKATFLSTSQLISCALSSHLLAPLDAHAAMATAIVVGAVKPWVLNLPGTQGFVPQIPPYLLLLLAICPWLRRKQ